MKKIPIISALTLGAAFAGVLASPPTNAISVEYDDSIWYTAEELLEYKEIVDEEIRLACDDDLNCEEALFFDRLDNEDEFRALNSFLEGRFWITTINPTAEYLETIYFDEDPMLKRWGVYEKQPLDFIFLAWFDSVNGQVFNYNYQLPIKPQFSDDLHLLYADYSESIDNENGFPANHPFTLPIFSTGLEGNQLGRIYHSVDGEMFNSKGYSDYSYCINSEFYQPGQDCVLAFAEGRGSQYLPASVLTGTIEPDSPIIVTGYRPDEPIIENETIDDETIDEEITEDIPAEDSSEVVSSEETTAETTISPKTPKTPNTGDAFKGCERTVEFPWWLGALIIVGNLTCLWLFWPKKGIDKNKKVR